MQIAQNVKESLELLSNVNLDFLSFVEKNPACLTRDNFKELEELRNKLHFLQAWPTFLGGETKKMFREAGVKLFDLIKSIPERVFQNDTRKMATFYELPESLVGLQMDGITRGRLDNLLARGDFILSPSGLKCLEYNVAGILGGHLLPLWEALYLKNPLILRFLKEYGITIKNKNLLGQYLAHCMQAAEPQVSRFGDTEINVALVLKGDTQANLGPMAGYLDRLYQELLQREYPPRSGNMFLCDFPALDVRDDSVYYKGRRIHALTEWHFGVTPPRIMKAFKAGNISVMNGPITGLMSAKSNLALLSEHKDSGMFNHEEKQVIEKYVPWTRKITAGETVYRGERIRLEDFILSHKDEFVIKSSLGLGGDSVYIGKTISRDEWEEKVKAALLKKNWVVQEAVESRSALYQHGEIGCAVYDMVWGFFIFGSHYAGTFLRVILKKNAPRIVNTHQGAQVSAVFEVGEEE